MILAGGEIQTQTPSSPILVWYCLVAFYIVILSASVRHRYWRKVVLLYLRRIRSDTILPRAEALRMLTRATHTYSGVGCRDWRWSVLGIHLRTGGLQLCLLQVATYLVDSASILINSYLIVGINMYVDHVRKH